MSFSALHLFRQKGCQILRKETLKKMYSGCHVFVIARLSHLICETHRFKNPLDNGSTKKCVYMYIWGLQTGPFVEPKFQSKHGEAAPSCYAAHKWNKLLMEVKWAQIINAFEYRLSGTLPDTTNMSFDSNFFFSIRMLLSKHKVTAIESIAVATLLTKPFHGFTNVPLSGQEL